MSESPKPSDKAKEDSPKPSNEANGETPKPGAGAAVSDLAGRVADKANGDSTDSDARSLDKLLEMRARRIKAIKDLENGRESTIFVFWNLDSLKQDDFFILADALEAEEPEKDLELFLLSPGGSGEAGYRIGHTFQKQAEVNKRKFRVVVPLYAKSAATILTLGAHEIVMGLQSEIGPIDPQIPKYSRSRQLRRYVPAMCIMDGLKLISEYSKEIPMMGKFFEEIIRSEQIGLDDLGELERSRESGKQYGAELLTGGMIPDEKVAREAVDRLADYYKFHGHPIDAFEAQSKLNTNLQNHRLVIARRRSRRSNPECTARTLDCFAPLAMTVNDFAGWYNLIIKEFDKKTWTLVKNFVMNIRSLLDKLI